MHDPAPKITVPSRIGVCLLTFAAGRLDPHVLPRIFFDGLTAVGVSLVLWAAAAYVAELARNRRSRSNQGAATAPSIRHPPRSGRTPPPP